MAESACNPMPARMRGFIGAHIACHTASGASASRPSASGARSCSMHARTAALPLVSSPMVKPHPVGPSAVCTNTTIHPAPS